MGLLVKLMGAARVIEFGTFTGYSSLAMALAGASRITCADVSKEWTDIARRYWEKAGVAGRIDLHLDGGSAVIARLLAAGEAGRFDLAFIDADKPGYDAYYEGSLQLLRPGGLILVDNTLWGGDVADPSKQNADTGAIRAINAKLVADPRVEICMVPISDGLTMARKA
jgi:caffeoyl-CoA O-methyltransferase